MLNKYVTSSLVREYIWVVIMSKVFLIFENEGGQEERFGGSPKTPEGVPFSGQFPP